MRVGDYHEELGRTLGYPECCLQEFGTPAHLDDPNWPDRPLIGTGFVPCKKCAESKTADDLIVEIVLNRTHRTPFPLY